MPKVEEYFYIQHHDGQVWDATLSQWVPYPIPEECEYHCKIPYGTAIWQLDHKISDPQNCTIKPYKNVAIKPYTP